MVSLLQTSRDMQMKRTTELVMVYVACRASVFCIVTTLLWSRTSSCGKFSASWNPPESTDGRSASHVLMRFPSTSATPWPRWRPHRVSAGVTAARVFQCR